MSAALVEEPHHLEAGRRTLFTEGRTVASQTQRE